MTTEIQPALGILESKSLWYRYKTTVWCQGTPQEAVVHNIMRVLRSIHYTGEFAYVSVPITSGRFLYELKLRKPTCSLKEQIEEAIGHNYYAGWKFTEELKENRSYPILFPADLIPVHQEWEQDHFQALWLSIIAEKCTEIYMSDGWEFSNGGSEEFTHVMQLQLGLPRHQDLIFYNTKEHEEAERARTRNIKVFDHRGEPLSLGNGITLIQKSLAWLGKKRFDAPKLENCLALLHWTNDLIARGFYQ